MMLDNLIDEVRQRTAISPKLGYRVRLDLDGAGVIAIDGTAMPPSVSTGGEDDADATLKMSAESLSKLLDGSLDPTLAFMTGKLKVSGSMAAALKIAQMLEE
ncbi:MAG: SCP2 sterol-binding domain-containing protein [Inquilinus sp.]|nr:SCP2 sterol-binding domain-containing protein [Inquilinus sp.]